MSNALPFSGAEHEEDTSIEMSCSNAARNSESALVEPGNTGLDTMNDGDDITDESHILESFAGTESTGEAGTEPAPEKLPEEGGEATDTTEEKEFVDPPDSAPITPAYNIADISGSTSALPEDSDEQHSAPVCLPAGEVFGFRRIEYVENVSEEMVAISVEVSGEFGEDPGEEPGEVVSTPEEAVTDSEGWDVDPSEYAPISVETGEVLPCRSSGVPGHQRSLGSRDQHPGQGTDQPRTPGSRRPRVDTEGSGGSRGAFGGSRLQPAAAWRGDHRDVACHAGGDPRGR